VISFPFGSGGEGTQGNGGVMMKHFGSQVHVKVFFSILLILLIASGMSAQTVNGNLLGSVLDQQQAAVANAPLGPQGHADSRIQISIAQCPEEVL
jgi:hypothetical protein